MAEEAMGMAQAISATAAVIPPGRERCRAYRALPGGRELVLYRMLFTWRLCLGEQGAMTYERHWCFPVAEFERVAEIVATWDGEGDPPGPVIKSDRD
jgi:hypothetical protein